MADKDISQVQKDFELFGKGIERLEELKQELASLDTSGFELEVEKIRPLLKQVSAIPQIERALAALKEKIDRRRSARWRGRKTPKIKVRRSHSRRQRIVQRVGRYKEARAQLRKRVAFALSGEKKLLARKLHADLKSRQALFKKKEETLRKRYEQLYQQRLTQALGRRVDGKFKERLQKQYAAEKKALEKHHQQKREQEYQQFAKELAAALAREKEIIHTPGAQQLTGQKKALIQRCHQERLLLRKKYDHKVAKTAVAYRNALAGTQKKLEDAYAAKVRLSDRVSKEFRERLTVRMQLERRKLARNLTEELTKHKREVTVLGRIQLAVAKKSQLKTLSREYATMKEQYLNHVVREHETYQKNLQQQYEQTLSKEVGILQQRISQKERALEGMNAQLRKRLEGEKNRIEGEKKRIETSLGEGARLKQKYREQHHRQQVQLQRALQKKIRALKAVKEKLHAEHARSLAREKELLAALYAQKEKRLREHLGHELQDLKKKLLVQNQQELEHEVALRKHLADAMETTLSL